MRVALDGHGPCSLNTVFARLALRHLSPTQLEDTARALGFGEPLPFDIPVQVSELHFPTDPLGFARTAAGFWNSTLFALEAVLTSGLHDRARWRADSTARRCSPKSTASTARPIWTSGPAPTLQRAVLPATAQALTTMMEHTVSDGTSYRAFHDGKGTPFLPGVSVAGKTGTLNDEKSRRFYTWFTGFAPSRPIPNVRQVAIAVLVVNLPTWRVKANVLAREMLHEISRRKKSWSILRLTTTRALASPQRRAARRLRIGERAQGRRADSRSCTVRGARCGYQ